MTDDLTYTPPEGVHGPTLGALLPDGVERVRADDDPATREAEWMSYDGPLPTTLYWWREPAPGLRGKVAEAIYETDQPGQWSTPYEDECLRYADAALAVPEIAAALARPAIPEWDDDDVEAVLNDLNSIIHQHCGSDGSDDAHCDWVNDLANEVVRYFQRPDVLHAPPPVPPWPGAVLSGLVDEDGVPTWLAQAGQVRGERVRVYQGFPWLVDRAFTPAAWVEVRAPRAPETERVPWWAAKDRLGLAGDPFVEVGSDDEGPWVRVVEGGTKLRSLVAPYGTVEVLKDGDR